MDKSSIWVSDSVTLTNCSNFDDGYTECLWDFGDGKSEYSKGTAIIKHQYNTPGQFEIKLTIGEKENNSEFIKTVIVQ
jgi:PKD repeat protein